MVHPGLADPIPPPGRLAQSRPRELAALLEADIPGLAREMGIELVSYALREPS
jgi:hypothetical protein